MIAEDLRDWFGKGKKGGVGGGGWDRYNSSGDRIGKCGDAKEGDAYSACLSKEKADKLGKAGRASFVKRKRAAQKKGGDAKKGGEQSKGQKAIKVKTGVKEEMSPRESEKIGMPFKGKHSRKLKDNLDPKTFKDTGKSSPYGSGYQELEERMNLFLEKNTPTMPDKWAYATSQARAKFDVYPSAYANAWASKKYKELGGRWRKSAKKESVLKLESDLLKVSKPYEYQPGDTVRNINPTCTHYKSIGILIYVHSNGDLTYKVLNSGSTYQPGDQLTKSQDQMMKVLGPRLKLPAFESKLNECVITKLHVEDSTVLAKNRDRGYKAKIQVIHELINGIEVVYLRDTLTDWSEGMNEYGIGIVNASLQVEFDEKEGDLAKRNLDKGKSPQVSYDGLKIRTALSKKKLSEAVKSVISFIGEDKHDVGVKGQTIIANTKYAFVIEMTSKHLPVIKKIDKHEVVVRTNHGIDYPDTGYTSGVKRDSSISRMTIALDHLKKVKKKSEVLDVLNKQYTKDNFLNPYRRKNKFHMETTSQVMYDLDKLEFILKWDIDHSEFSGIVNNLPKGYEPKIKIKVSKTD